MKAPARHRALSEQLAELAEPTRLRLLVLLEREELSVGEVASVVQMPQSTVSRHLKLLAEGGWLVRRSVGTASYYRLVAEELDPGASALWQAVRSRLDDIPERHEDDRRLVAVLADRRADSVAFFGRLAGEWDELRRGLFGAGFTAPALLSLLPDSWTIADLGCGTGNASEQVAPCVSRVLAIDQSEAMLDAARKRLADAHNIEYRVGGLEALPLEDSSVDAAICLLVLHHIEEPLAAMREMFRVLRRDRGGGVALIVDMVEHRRTEYRVTFGHRHLGFSRTDIEHMLQQAGFERTRVRELPSNPEGKGPGLFAATGWLGDP